MSSAARPSPTGPPTALALTAASKLVVVQMADLQVSRDPDATLITYALGSCVAVLVHDSRRGVGGLIHYMLPQSAVSLSKSQAKPAMFCDSGMPLLWQGMLDLGARDADFVVKVVGGAVINDTSGVFNIGRRNCVAVQQLLKAWGIRPAAWDVGGRKSRTVGLHIGSGRVFVRSRGREVGL